MLQICSVMQMCICTSVASAGDGDEQNVLTFPQEHCRVLRPCHAQDGEASDMDRRLLNITGVNHGTSIGIRCVDGYGRVPGAVENVECCLMEWQRPVF